MLFVNASIATSKNFVELEETKTKVFWMWVNNTMDNFTECPPGSLLDHAPIRIALIFCYIFVFLGCCLGNLLLLTVIGMQRSMRSATNFFLANLALADLLVAMFCIIQNCCHLLLWKHAHWPLGAAACHLYVYVLHLVPSVSSGLLILVSIERYVAVLHPILAKDWLTKNLLASLTALVWFISIVANVPYFLSTKHYHWVEFSSCSRNFSGPVDPAYLHLFSFLLFYCLPLLTMTFLYAKISVVLRKSISLSQQSFKCVHVKPEDSMTNCLLSDDSNDKVPLKPTAMSRLTRTTRSTNDDNPQHHAALSSRSSSVLITVKQKPPLSSHRGSNAQSLIESRKRVIILLVAVVLCFALMTLPHHVRMIWLFWTDFQLCNSSPLVLLQPISYLLLFLNSGINPFLYAFLSQRFRAAVKMSFRCKSGISQRSARASQHAAENLSKMKKMNSNKPRDNATTESVI